MLTSASAISIFRRDMTFGTVLRILMLAAAAGCMAMNFLPAGRSMDGTLWLLGIGMLWIALSYRSVKSQRLAAESNSRPFQKTSARPLEPLRSNPISIVVVRRMVGDHT